MLSTGTSAQTRSSRQKSFAGETLHRDHMKAEGAWANHSLHCQGRKVSAHCLSCNNSLPEALSALSEEPKRANLRWDQPVGVLEGSDPSASPGITKEQNIPSPLHSLGQMNASASSSGSSSCIPLEAEASHLTAQLNAQSSCKGRHSVHFCDAHIQRSHPVQMSAGNCVSDISAAHVPFPVVRSFCTLHQDS